MKIRPGMTVRPVEKSGNAEQVKRKEIPCFQSFLLTGLFLDGCLADFYTGGTGINEGTAD